MGSKSWSKALVVKKLSSNLPPIRSLAALSATLGVEQQELLAVSSQIENFWAPGPDQIKANGDVRKTNSARARLKKIHSRINSRILRLFDYPAYLHGSIYDPSKPRSPASNASAHVGAKIIIEEDIQGFFPGISSASVKSVWLRCFHYSDEVASLLTTLTTYRGNLLEGWGPSSYLANLVFWDKEPSLVSRLEAMGCTYTRYVDDIAVSSRRRLSNKQKTAIIRLLYGMMFSKGLKPKRSKHKVSTPKGRMVVTGLAVRKNSVTVPKSYHRNLAAAIHQLGLGYATSHDSPEYAAMWKTCHGKAHRVRQHNKAKGDKLLEKLAKIQPR